VRAASRPRSIDDSVVELLQVLIVVLSDSSPPNLSLHHTQLTTIHIRYSPIRKRTFQSSEQSHIRHISALSAASGTVARLATQHIHIKTHSIGIHTQDAAPAAVTPHRVLFPASDQISHDRLVENMRTWRKALECKRPWPRLWF
jgi:hypothetical protein